MADQSTWICLLVNHMHLNPTTIELNSMVTVNLLQVTPYSLVIFPSMLTETICLMFLVNMVMLFHAEFQLTQTLNNQKGSGTFNSPVLMKPRLP